ncbi:MAG: hypothetical protein RL037_1811 [Bacteroidota bacterium]|jgi:hypothetical protein
MKILLVSFLLLLSPIVFCQDSTFIKSIYDEALARGQAYNDLRELCKNIGPRLSGSAKAEMAIEWSEEKFNSYKFDNVFKQPIIVPHWERGTTESGWVSSKKGNLHKLNLLALGGSISTNGLMKGQLIEFSSLEELKKANKQKVAGKIVFINQKMDATFIQTFKAYGGCYAIRGEGAVEAAKKGAIAVLIRSLGLPIDEHPHTGSMRYDKDTPKIPAAAISTLDAEIVSKWLETETLNASIELNCKEYPDAPSFNVMGELKGKDENSIISFGGHLDSWDTGEGAHDDGAGVIHCMEALRILKELGYKPKHTLRVVFFMNEENGNAGGKAYATWTKEKGENQVAALESDRGGFAPRGFSCDGSEEYTQLISSFSGLFSPYDLHVFEKGYGGVDIGPLKNTYPGIPLFGFVPDSQRYFDFHHAPSDVFENVNERELALGAAGIAAFIYLLDKELP